MEDYIDATWRPVLAAQGFTDFNALWQLDTTWFEEPNRRRKGWSGVSRVELPGPAGTTVAIFLKRQENHNTFSWRRPLRGIPTFAREFRHIMRYHAYGIPALDPVYFAVRTVDGNTRAILATVALVDHTPLDIWSRRPHTFQQRANCVIAVANLLHHMHRHRIQHNCLFPKHVFVRDIAASHVEVRVIDLEKSHWRPLRIFCTLRDLDTLNRYALDWTTTSRMRFLKAYLHIAHLTPYAKWLWRRLAARAAKKQLARS